MIEKYKRAIRSGSVKELLVILDSHGSENRPAESTHQIAAGSGERVSLDSLKSLADLAKTYGVKLAIADMSCNSGNTLALANEKTCVISAAGTENFAYDSFSNAFMSNMKPGKNLEEVFLETRRSVGDNPSYPMISTPAGEELNHLLYQGMRPYLYYVEGNNVDARLFPYLMDLSSSCTREKDGIAPLMAQFEHLKALTADPGMQFSRIKDLLKRYRDLQDFVAANMRSWDLAELKTNESCSAPFGVSKKLLYESTYSREELLRSDFNGGEQIGELTESMGRETDPDTKSEIQAEITCMKYYERRRDEIIAANPHLANYDAKYRSLISSIGETRSLATEIGNQEKKIYDTFYKDLSKLVKGTNACKDFVL